MDKKSSSLGIVVGVVAALLIGGFGGYAIANSKDSDSSSMAVSEKNPSTITKAANLRVDLNSVMRRHVTLATVALKDLAANSPETDAAVAALDVDSVDLSKAIGSVYGAQAESDFLALWRKHIGFFVDYTKAVVAKDQAGMDMAKSNLAGYTEDAASFFENANPDNIDKDALKQGLQMHADQVVKIVDAYAAADYKTSFETEAEAYDHIGAAADTLSAAIVKQYPAKF